MEKEKAKEKGVGAVKVTTITKSTGAFQFSKVTCV